MDPQEFENANSREQEDPNEEIEKLCLKYNVSLDIIDNSWQARTTLPHEKAGEVLERFGTISSPEEGTDVYNTYSVLAGSFIRQTGEPIPKTRMEIGNLPRPPGIRKLTFMGEFKDDDQDLQSKIFHELSHVAIFYEMVGALEKLYPNANLDDSIKFIEELVKSLRASGRPLSMLDEMKNTGGSKFYDEGELVYEDLAEALAVRFEGEESWENYKKYVKQSETGKKYFSDLEGLINTIYAGTKN
ncbi:hypothetical protein HYW46_01780 [Candidatus Daviesbacteria bacterium]|nr:hypothetical protein [Candidatus Daviesbacteria bacterium]